MDIGPIARRYAHALLLYAMENAAEDQVYEQVEKLTAALQQVHGLRAALESLGISKSEKVKLLCNAVSQERTCLVLVNFFHMVLDNKRQHLMMFILNSFMFAYRKQKRIRCCRLITAVPMSDEKLKELEQTILHYYRGRRVEFDVTVNPDIIGGCILELGYIRVDASVAGGLKNIKKNMVEKNKRIV